MKQSLISILFVLISIQLCYSQSFKSVDFEAGGYVTEVYYVNVFNIPTLFARTDIGGVYSTEYNYDKWRWNDWTFLNTFATSPAGLHVQGFLGYPGFYNIVCCGTDYLNGDPNRGLWRYDWATNDWIKELYINYGENDFHSKIGGECIISNWEEGYHILYTGGRYEDGNLRSEIYRSTDMGETWLDINPSIGDFVKGNVSTIVACMIEDNHHIWVGTDYGIWRGEKQPNNSFIWYSKKPGQPPIAGYYELPMLPKREMESASSEAHYGTPVHRIVIKSDASKIFATQGEEIWRSDDYGENWINLTYYFDGEAPTGSWGHVISAVNLFDDETKLLVSRIGWPTKISEDYGITWGEEIDCTVNQASLPKHKCEDWDQHISYSRTNFLIVQEPLSENWYSSGPFNLYRSKESDFSTTEWEFVDVDKNNYTHGINFTVVYDVTFGKGSNPYIYVPIADLIEARIDKRTIPSDTRIHIVDYAREHYTQNECDEYMSNATRVLVSEANHNKVYLIGGDLYHSFKGSILRSDDQGGWFNKTNPQGINLDDAEHCIIDGLVSDSDADKILVLVGGGENPYQIWDDNTRGVWWSDDGGYTFAQSTGLSGEAWVDELFGHQTNLIRDPNDEDIIYLYLEGQDGGEQFYRSGDGGHQWTKIETIFPNPTVTWHNKGCLAAANNNGSTTLYLAMGGSDKFNGGLFKSINNGTTWSRFTNWTSASQIVAKENLLYVFGKKVDDSYNKIYRSTDGGNTFPHVITNNDYNLPSTSHLTIDPDNSNILWVSTSGQGVYRIDTYGDYKSNDNTITNNIPFNYSLEQNYPNPFNPISTINYSIAKDGLVKITVYDLLGRKVNILVNEYKSAGSYEVTFNNSSYASGVYLYRMESGNFTSMKKMVLIK